MLAAHPTHGGKRQVADAIVSIGRAGERKQSRACGFDGTPGLISEMLLTEFTRTLAYPRLRKQIPQEKAAAYLDWIRDRGSLADDPVAAPVSSRDPDDDYLLALAIEQRGYLVTGDQDLLVRNTELPILTPAQFVAELRDPTLSN